MYKLILILEKLSQNSVEETPIKVNPYRYIDHAITSDDIVNTFLVDPAEVIRFSNIDDAN